MASCLQSFSSCCILAQAVCSMCLKPVLYEFNVYTRRLTRLARLLITYRTFSESLLEPFNISLSAPSAWLYESIVASWYHFLLYDLNARGFGVTCYQDYAYSCRQSRAEEEPSLYETPKQLLVAGLFMFSAQDIRAILESPRLLSPALGPIS